MKFVMRYLRCGTGGCGAAEWWGEPSRRAARPTGISPIIGVAGVSPATGATGIPPVAAYGLASNSPESKITAHLFKLYAEKMAK